MKGRYFLCAVWILAALIVSQATWAGGDDHPVYETARNGIFEGCPGVPCSCSCTDPYDPRLRFTSGMYSGLCFTTCHKRSAIMLPFQELEPYFGQRHHVDQWNSFALANVYHDGRFYVARFNLAALEEVILQLEYFDAIVPAAHSELRFRFRSDTDVELTPQDPADSNRPVLFLRDLVFSIEAIFPVRVSYNLGVGLMKAYATAYRFVSLRQTAVETIEGNGQTIRQWSLRLSPRQEKEILRAAIFEANTRQYGAWYNTLTHSCTTELFDVVDTGVDFNPANLGARQRLENFLRYRVPTEATRTLELRGLIDENSEIQSLNEELGYGIPTHSIE